MGELVADQGPGGGWWLASDGRWYAPELHPAYLAPPPAPPFLPSLSVPPPDATSLLLRGQVGEAPATSGFGPTTASVRTYRTPADVRRGRASPWEPVAPPDALRRRPGGIRRVISNVMLATLVVGGVAFGGWKLFHRSPPGLSAYADAAAPQPPASLPAQIMNPYTRRAVQSTAIVDALGCSVNGVDRGSAWPISRHYFVTDAHVVGGSSGVAIQSAGQPLHLATVVYFNPNDDIALLYSPDSDAKPLVVADADPVRPVSGLFVGYPGSSGSTEVGIFGTVGGYDQANYNYPTPGAAHQVVDFSETGVGPGMSGGPIVNWWGQVVGQIQAGNPNGGQALPPSVISSTTKASIGRTGGVGDGQCPS